MFGSWGINFLPSLCLLEPWTTQKWTILTDVSSFSHDDFQCLILDRLKPLLENLPRQLPIKSAADSAFAPFLFFQIDSDLLEKTGYEVSALSEQLKRVFGWQARTTGDGIITIAERGPAVCALYKVLSEFWEHY